MVMIDALKIIKTLITIEGKQSLIIIVLFLSGTAVSFMNIKAGLSLIIHKC